MTWQPLSRGKGKGKGKGTAPAGPAERAVQAQAVLPLHGREGRPDRLQGCRHAARLHRRERQDHAGAPDGHQGALSAPARHGDQARALPGAAAVHRYPLSEDDYMQVILLEKVVNLGQLGDVVKVKEGYARNFLIPQGKARRATETAIKEFETRRADLEKAQADRLAAAQAVQAKLERHQRSRSRPRPASTAGCSVRSPTSTSPKRCQAGLRGQQGADPHAARPAQAGRRASDDRWRCIRTLSADITVSVVGEAGLNSRVDATPQGGLSGRLFYCPSATASLVPALL